MTDTVYAEALALYGKENQLRQAQEECGELIAAINQHLRHDRRSDAVVEEMADVWIVLTQLQLAFPKDEFDAAVQSKLLRLRERMEEEKILRNKLSQLPTAL